MMHWSNFFHIYQPPGWDEEIIRRVAAESYRPMIRILQSHPNVHITLNIAGALSEQLIALGLRDIIDDFRLLFDRGQIELVGSAMYHPILPLLPPDEIRRQIVLQDELNKKLFGQRYRPKGFFPPEMAYSQELEPILLDLGYEWVILDEVAADGQVGRVNLEQSYVTPGGLGIILRNRTISDFLSFSADVNAPARDINVITASGHTSPELVTAMDGENLGHHRRGVDQLWEFLVTQPGVTTHTLSAYRRHLTQCAQLSPKPSSWSSQPAEVSHGIPFGLWKHPDNPIHQLQWALTHLVITTVQHAPGDPQYDGARRLLDQQLTSDKYWWASASPWWDPGIVIRETQKLADVLAPLQELSPSVKNRTEHLMKQMTATVQLWEKSGLAKKRQETYLLETENVYYIGGERIALS